MANSRITEGVGKKIVEALKMQSEDINITPSEDLYDIKETSDVQETSSAEDFDFTETDIFEDVSDNNDNANTIIEENKEDNSDFDIQPEITHTIQLQPEFSTQTVFEPQNSFETPFSTQTNIQNIEEFEVPSNVAVLKQLITKLPAGVTKQTGALIIKQTMEALGISMKSVLQEAQQVQENLNNSTRECQASISEYKKQIGILEKQAQKYQRQYAALNDIISLFVQTNF